MAEKRKRDIGAFLQGLFRLSDEISHSDLVYTFFHPLHRDQEEANIHINKLKGIYFFGKHILALIFICKQRQEDTREIRVLAEFVAGLNCPYPTRKEPYMFWFIISRTSVLQIPRG